MIGKGRELRSLARTARCHKLGDFFVCILDLKTQIAVKEELAFARDGAALPILREALRLPT